MGRIAILDCFEYEYEHEHEYEYEHEYEHGTHPNTRKKDMSIPYYQVDTFTSEIFSGNPAGVCFLAQWLDDAVLQSIAAENYLPETAFVVQRESSFGLRWLPPRWKWICVGMRLWLPHT